ncbi:ferrochelatase [Corynebacterium cystitidis]|uniref:Coproporphyrin III ferrochelatase n=1 Tax=Corynebacterium cystitidis DSM 20524 TaxID=1121357 RepID=A0A1H9PLY2_9CORY|nr:ferrochelatase [Corynebacterium cystitidis]WJY82450.1 Ferrochelatase [Corynebacterium cystitidis DSM 20524]SER49100.1 ferrochelatase [Corynebacterium cystitidis DSM 20524]SNV75537.1 ferrochelatase [Corynebacterium cystitidis]
MSMSDYDALLVLSFGGPESNDEVVPFLENVTRGRGIPRERLEQVGEHYFHFDGVSPLNRLNREIIENLEDIIEERGHELPVYFGNRNWHPMAKDTAEQIARDGHSNVLVFATSAWGGYSACRQYDEDIVDMREATSGVDYTKLWQFYAHPTFIRLMAKDLKKAWDSADKDATKVLFTAHSVPTVADEVAGGPGDPHLYSRQVAESSRLIAEAAGIDDYEVVWQSRSGSPRTPWLEPDVVDRTEELSRADESFKHLICVPVGFISDHMEVIWDLDTELKEACDEAGISLERTPTVGHTRDFAEMVIDIVENVGQDVAPQSLSTVTVQGCTVNGAPCAPGCCKKD